MERYRFLSALVFVCVVFFLCAWASFSMIQQIQSPEDSDLVVKFLNDEVLIQYNQTEITASELFSVNDEKDCINQYALLDINNDRGQVEVLVKSNEARFLLRQHDRGLLVFYELSPYEELIGDGILEISPVKDGYSRYKYTNFHKDFSVQEIEFSTYDIDSDGNMEEYIFNGDIVSESDWYKMVLPYLYADVKEIQWFLYDILKGGGTIVDAE